MKPYKSIKDQNLLKESNINQIYRDVNKLYNIHKSEFTRLTDLVNFIVAKLHISPGVILQILQGM